MPQEKTDTIEPVASPRAWPARVPETAGVVLAYITCAIIWGTTWYAIRVCVSPSGFSPFLAAALRFTVAALVFACMWPLGVVRAGNASGRNIAWLVVAGLLSSLGFGLVYTAERWVSGGMAAIISSTTPLMMAVVATVSRTERVSRASVAGSLIALTGVLVIFQDSLQASSTQALAVLMLLGSVATSTVNNAILKHNTREQNPMFSAAFYSLVCGLVFWLLAAVVERRPVAWPVPLVPSLAVVYLGIFGSVTAFVAYFYLLKRVRLMTISTLVFYPPLIALGVDALLEKSFTPTPGTYLAMGITLLGVGVSLFGPRGGRF